MHTAVAQTIRGAILAAKPRESGNCRVKAVSEVIWGMLEQKKALISARKISR